MDFKTCWASLVVASVGVSTNRKSSKLKFLQGIKNWSTLMKARETFRLPMLDAIAIWRSGQHGGLALDWIRLVNLKMAGAESYQRW